MGYEWTDTAGDKGIVTRHEIVVKELGVSRVVFVGGDENRQGIVEALYGEPVTVIKDSELPEVSSRDYGDGFLVEGHGYAGSRTAEFRREGALRQLAIARHLEGEAAKRAEEEKELSELAQGLASEYYSTGCTWNDVARKAKELLSDAH